MSGKKNKNWIKGIIKTETKKVLEDKTDKQISELQIKLSTVEDKRKEERFLWAVCVMLLITVRFDCSSFYQFLLLIFLDIFFIMVMAHYCGVEWAKKLGCVFFNKFFSLLKVLKSKND